MGEPKSSNPTALKSLALLPDPATYEEEYRFWPWGKLIERVVDFVVEAAIPNAAAFDYMCGTGYLLSEILARRHDIKGRGCDIHLPFISYANARRPNLNIEHADARTFCPPSVQDIILCTSGLHHLEFQDQDPFLRKLFDECDSKTLVIIAEEMLAPYATEFERLQSAVSLNCDLIRLGIEQGWPSNMLDAALGVLRNDVLQQGEYKRDLNGWTSLIGRYFKIEEVTSTWTAASGGGDYLLLCCPHERSCE